MRNPTRGLVTAAILVALAGATRAADLTVEVLNARPDRGDVLGAAYGNEGQWLKEPAQGARQPGATRTVLVYRNLPAGPYAVVAFQDENGNGKLDRNVLGMPVEPYGFSRDAASPMGPPAFPDAVIDLQADTTITIHLR